MCSRSISSSERGGAEAFHRRRSANDLRRQMLGKDRAVATEDRGVFDGVFELPDVPGPVVRQQVIEAGRIQTELR